MSWGKGVTDFPLERAADSPSRENRVWGGSHESKGVQSISSDNLEGSFRPQCQPIRAGPSKRRPRVPEDQCYKPANAATSLPDGSRGGWEGGTGTGTRGSGWAFLTLEASHLLVGHLHFLTVDVSCPADTLGMCGVLPTSGTLRITLQSP